MKKYCDVFTPQAVLTTMSNTRLSFTGSIPYTSTHISALTSFLRSHFKPDVLVLLSIVCARYLIDLVDHSEGTAVELLQCHQVQHGGHAAFPTALMVRGELVQLCATAKLHTDADAVLIILLLFELL